MPELEESRAHTTMPPGLCRIATVPGRFTESAEAYASAWVSRRHLLVDATDRAKLSAMGPGALASHCFPKATEMQTGLLAAWMSWLFVLDDRNDEGPQGRMPDAFADELASIYNTAFLDEPASGMPLAAALRDLWHEVRTPMPLFWRHRFRRNVDAFFSACVSQAAHRALAEVPSPESFPQVRRDSGAIWPSFDLIEWMQGYALPPSLSMSRCYRELSTAAADVVCWTNDLLTMEKESAFDDVYNYVFVLRHAHACGLRSAMEEVAERTEARLQSFFLAEAALPETLHRLGLGTRERAHVMGIVSMLRAWMRGHVDWGETTGRYAPLR